MAKRRFTRLMALILALVLAISVINGTPGNGTAKAATTQSEIDKLKSQQKEIQKKAQELKSQINSLEYDQKSALAKKEVLDMQIQITQDDIDNITAQIAQYVLLIEEKNADIAAAQREEDEQLAKFKLRIRAMEESGSITYLSIIFEADSFADLLARLDFIGEVMEYDEELYVNLKAAKQATIDAKISLENAKKAQEDEKLALIDKEAELERQQADAAALLDKINEDIAAAKELYQQELDAGNKIQNDINKKMAELKKQQQVKGTGKLIWPTPSSNKVTSQFGIRPHPIFHENRKHNGVDIGAKYGADILASDGGQVIISAYSSSYGNYVVISHGNGMATLYAHMSQRLVKENDKVSQGQKIGKVGSTGNSTGPHLHFEVSVNGEKKNPLQWFDSSTYVIVG